MLPLDTLLPCKCNVNFTGKTKRLKQPIVIFSAVNDRMLIQEELVTKT